MTGALEVDGETALGMVAGARAFNVGGQVASMTGP